MKKTQKILLIAALVAGLVLPVAALAGGPVHARHQAGHPGPRAKGELGLMTRYVHRNLTVKALAETSGQEEAAVRRQLDEAGLRAFLERYQVERQAFHKAMKAQVDALMADLARNGYLTAEQRERVGKRLEARARQRDLLRRLVENGMVDGTITPEEGKMLLRRKG